MKSRYILPLFLFISGFAKAQTHVYGNVTDVSGEAVAYAVVYLTDATDSTVASSCATDTNGFYSVNTPKNNVVINVSCLGYIPQSTTVTKSGDVRMDFTLEENMVELNEVTVKGKNTGIQYRGDTIRYNTDVFKDGSERTLGDLLNKLPGIESDEKGSVKVQGKNVSKVLLEGQNVFGNNAQLATKNLSAEAVKNVEVLNNYSEYSLLRGFQTHNETVINVNVKETFLGRLSGDAELGGGIENKYKADAHLMFLKPALMTYLTGTGNNNGNEVFNIEDFIRMSGGLQGLVGDISTGSRSVRLNLSEAETRLLAPSDNVLSRTNSLASCNIFAQPSQKLKINASLIFNSQDEKTKNNSLNDYLLPQLQSFSMQEKSDGKNDNKIYGASIKITSTPNDNLLLLYNGKINYSSLSKNLFSQISSKAANISNYADDFSESTDTKHTVSFIKKINNLRLTGDLAFGHKKNNNKYDLNGDSLLLPLTPRFLNGFYDIGQNRNSLNNMFVANISSLLKINGRYAVGFGFALNCERQSLFSAINDNNSNISTVNNDVKTDLSKPEIFLKFMKNEGLLRYGLGFKYEYDKIDDNPDFAYENTYNALYPEIQASLHFSEQNILSASFDMQTVPIGTQYLNEGMFISDFRNYNIKHRLSGRFSEKRALNVSYTLYNMYYNTMLSLNGNYSENKNTNSYNISSNGFTTERQVITIPETNNFQGNIIFSKGFDFPWTTKLSCFYNSSHSSNRINDVKNNIKHDNIRLRASINSRYKTFNTEFYCKFDNNRNGFSVRQGTFKQNTFVYGGILRLNLDERLLAELCAEQERTDYDNDRRDRTILDFSVRYKFGGNWTAAISGQNVLHLRSEEWVRLYLTDLYRSENYYYRLPGNIMLSLRYEL